MKSTTKQEVLDLNIELVGKWTEIQTFKELVTVINAYNGENPAHPAGEIKTIQQENFLSEEND